MIPFLANLGLGGTTFGTPPDTSEYALRELSLNRTPVYKAVFETGPTTFSTHKIRVRAEATSETDSVSELFSIDETKEYVEFDSYPEVDHSPIGDMFPFSQSWTLATSFPYMHIPSTTSPMQIYPEQGHCSVGAVSLTILDIDEEMTALVSQVLFGQEVTIYGGFADMDESDYLIVYKGTVQSMSMTPDFTAFDIQLHNTQALVNKQLFQAGASVLDSGMDETQVVSLIRTGDETNFQESGYILIDAEIIRYERFGALISLEERGAFGTVAASHSAQAAVQEIFPIGPAHPIDIALDIYYGSPSKTCLGLRYSDIDWTAFAEARAIMGEDFQMEFFVRSAANAMEWLSNEIYLVTGSYPYVNADGELSIKAFGPATEPEVTFDHDNIVEQDGRPNITWGFATGNLGQPINDVTINYDLDVLTGEFKSYFREVRSDSIENYGNFPVVINSSGLRFDLPGTSDFILDRVEAILDRYEDGAPVITIRTHLQKQMVDVGDTIALTSRLLPNRTTGSRGITDARAEVINRSVQWDDGYVDFTLLGADDQL